MRILILGDSVPFARPKHEIYLEQTWPFLLEQNNFSVTIRSKGGSTISDVLRELQELVFYYGNEKNKPFEFIIIQIGIVDVSPRSILYPPFFDWFLYKIKLNKFAEIIKRSNFIYKIFSYNKTSIKKFNKIKLLINNTSRLLSSKIIYLAIAPPIKNLKSNLGDFSKKVDLYNNVLKIQSNNEFFLNPYQDEIIENLILEDGHHLSKNGHHIIYKKIISLLNDEII